MLHWHYIGHIDPRHPLDLSLPHCPPKPIRPIPTDLVTRLADKFGVVVGEEVIDCGGYLLSHLGYFGQLHPFEAELVVQGCVVLTEMRIVVQPPEAVRAYQEFLDEWATSRAAQDLPH
jgi:hypothetical protein